jgi:hypothetical protein
MTEEVQAPTPLLVPSAGLPEVIATEDAFSLLSQNLLEATAPLPSMPNAQVAINLALALTSSRSLVMVAAYIYLIPFHSDQAIASFQNSTIFWLRMK